MSKLVTVPCSVCGRPLLCEYDPSDDRLQVSDRGDPCACLYTEGEYDALVRAAAEASREREVDDDDEAGEDAAWSEDGGWWIPLEVQE